jgi:hypothetical protein
MLFSTSHNPTTTNDRSTLKQEDTDPLKPFYLYEIKNTNVFSAVIITILPDLTEN